MTERLCLVEDDPTIRELVALKLSKKGYLVDVFECAEEVLQKTQTWDLYILDVLLNGEATGIELCRSLREKDTSVPILILSALSEPADRIEGLRGGADDYLAKPFEMEELLLRIQGMLRRRSWYARLPVQGASYQWSDCAIDFLRLEGRKGNRAFPMSGKECMLMKLLVEQEGEVISRDAILDKVWGYDVFPSSRTVDNFILRLRKYFEDDSSRPRYIHSVRGMGYRFTSKEPS